MQSAHRTIVNDREKTLAQKIAECRARRGLNQQRFAELIGDAQSNVSKMERGEARPKERVLNRLNKLFLEDAANSRDTTSPALTIVEPSSEPLAEAKRLRNEFLALIRKLDPNDESDDLAAAAERIKEAVHWVREFCERRPA
jgi:transcriptional regulator with XRE-family HTH domain